MGELSSRNPHSTFNECRELACFAPENWQITRQNSFWFLFRQISLPDPSSTIPFVLFGPWVECGVVVWTEFVVSVENLITTTPKYRRKTKNMVFRVYFVFQASRPGFYSINGRFGSMGEGLWRESFGCVENKRATGPEMSWVGFGASLGGNSCQIGLEIRITTFRSFVLV